MKLRLLLVGATAFVLTISAAGVTTSQTASSSTPRTTKGSISGGIVKAGTGEPLRKALVTLLPAQQGRGGQNGFAGANGGSLAAPDVGLLGNAQPGQQVATPAQNGQLQNPQGAQRGQAPAGGAKSIVTGDDGAFTFPDLDAGQYRISVERDGFLTQEYGQRSWNGTGTPITLDLGQKVAGISVQMIVAGTIIGVIRDDHGEPLAGVQVQALSYTYQQGTRTLTSSRQTQTNDVGEYRLYWLPPAEYYISTTPGIQQIRVTTGTQGGRGGPVGRGGPGGGALLNPTVESYAPTYYPGFIEPESAVGVALGPAAEIRGLDFKLRTIPTVKVKGRVTSPEAIPPLQNPGPGARGPQDQGQRGQRGQGGPFPPGGVDVLLTRIGPGTGGRGGPGGPSVPDAFGGRGGRGGPGGPGGLNEPSSARVNTDGTFEISNVIPGSYNLTAIQQSQNRILSARTRVDVGASGLDFVGVDLRYGISITGQIQLEGPSAQFRMNGLRVSLTPNENLPFGNADAQVDAEGKFTLTNVGAMSYRITVAGLNNGSYLISGRYGSTEALNDLLQVSDAGTKLVLQVGSTPGTVSGVAKDKSGQAFRAATCVLIPTARNRTDLYRTATSDLDGKFSFTNVAPGDYKVIAWEDVPRGAYMDPTFFKNYEDRARPVPIGKGETVAAEVQVITANAQ